MKPFADGANSWYGPAVLHAPRIVLHMCDRRRSCEVAVSATVHQRCFLLLCCQRSLTSYGVWPAPPRTKPRSCMSLPCALGGADAAPFTLLVLQASCRGIFMNISSVQTRKRCRFAAQSLQLSPVRAAGVTRARWAHSLLAAPSSVSCPGSTLECLGTRWFDTRCGY